jgi:hypothetical protein
MEEKLRDMEEMKIDVAVLSHGIPFGPDVLDGQEADDWAKRINDNLAEIIDRYPGKFAGFGSIGFGDSQRSIAEVDRCIKKLGFKGIQVFSNVSNKLLDSSEFAPVLKHIGMLGVPIHLHPAVPLNRVGLESVSRFLPLGFPYDTSLNTFRLIQGGLLDETPDLELAAWRAKLVWHCWIRRLASLGKPRIGTCIPLHSHLVLARAFWCARSSLESLCRSVREIAYWGILKMISVRWSEKACSQVRVVRPVGINEIVSSRSGLLKYNLSAVLGILENELCSVQRILSIFRTESQVFELRIPAQRTPLARAHPCRWFIPRQRLRQSLCPRKPARIHPMSLRREFDDFVEP